MKKLFIIFWLIVFCMASALNAKEVDSTIYITQYNKVIGKMTKEQFTLLIKAADSYEQIMLAQKEDRIKIISEAIIYNKKQDTYNTKIRISWINKNGEEINYIVSDLTLNINNDITDNIPKWRIVYRNVAEYGFPITGGFLLLLILLL